MRRFLIAAAILIVVLLGAGGTFYVMHDEPLPQGEAGAAADALAARMEQAANVEAWKRTGAVRWTFRGRNHHLWDRQRNLVEVRWGEDRALLRLDTREGLAFHAGLPLDGMRKRSFLRMAYRFWANDSFWLNPIAKLRDPGVVRERVQLEGGGEGLLVRYTSGGVTPGDAYLWIPGPDGLPTEWRMWVKIMPLGGVRTTWERWETLATGAKVSMRHQLSVVGFALSDVEAAATLQELVGDEDPFAPLFAPAP